MDNLEEQLTNAGLKLTKPRLVILETLQKKREPITAQELFKTVSGVDLVSIYRNLDTLNKIGIIFYEERNREKYYYFDKKEHHHLICRECGQSECLPCSHRFKTLKNFTNISHKILLEGTCQKCLI